MHYIHFIFIWQKSKVVYYLLGTYKWFLCTSRLFIQWVVRQFHLIFCCNAMLTKNNALSLYIYIYIYESDLRRVFLRIPWDWDLSTCYMMFLCFFLFFKGIIKDVIFLISLKLKIKHFFAGTNKSIFFRSFFSLFFFFFLFCTPSYL